MWIKKHDASGGECLKTVLYSQARNHCASNAAIFENTIQQIQEI